MRFLAYLKDKRAYLIGMLIGMSISEGYFYIFNINLYLKLLVAMMFLGGTMVPLLAEYFKKVGFYSYLEKAQNGLDKKYLFTELINRPKFLEGQIYYDAAVEINHNMCDEINLYKQNIREYKEYIEMWVHEAKTPIATTKLIIENYPSRETQNIGEEIDMLERYIEQVLYYSKIDKVEEDYKITKYNLKEIVHKVVLNNKKALIGGKIKIDLHDLDYEVQTDAKWLSFVLNQVINNSIKYRRQEGAWIENYGEKAHAQFKLIIKDNGIGIKADEIKKVCQKGFVGTNGRRNEASTGMGLYICKKLMEKMQHNFQITSKLNESTTVTCVFPLSNYFIICD